MINHRHWDKIWSQTKDDKGFWWWVQRENKGIRTRKIISYIERFLGNINGLKTVEVGSGAGVLSLVFAQHDAIPTLMDYSKEALLLARKYFSSKGLSATFLYADALNLDPNLRGKFDIAMSFGTVEHFQYPERFLIAKTHLELVRPGGVVIISVPNRWFLPHEIFKFYLKRRGKWHLGYEKAFSRQELFSLGNRIGLENREIGGSAFIGDLLRYFYIFQDSKTYRKFCQVRPKQPFIQELASPFDNLFGADIFLMGCKPFL